MKSIDKSRCSGAGRPEAELILVRESGGGTRMAG